jgi:hypothetical protein
MTLQWAPDRTASHPAIHRPLPDGGGVSNSGRFVACHRPGTANEIQAAASIHAIKSRQRFNGARGRSG